MRGEPVEVVVRWAGKGPRNVMVRFADGRLVVRPFRGLRRVDGNALCAIVSADGEKR